MALPVEQKVKVTVYHRPVVHPSTGLNQTIANTIFTVSGKDLRIFYQGGFAIIICDSQEVAYPMDRLEKIITERYKEF